MNTPQLTTNEIIAIVAVVALVVIALIVGPSIAGAPSASARNSVPSTIARLPKSDAAQPKIVSRSAANVCISSNRPPEQRSASATLRNGAAPSPLR